MAKQSLLAQVRTFGMACSSSGLAVSRAYRTVVPLCGALFGAAIWLSSGLDSRLLKSVDASKPHAAQHLDAGSTWR